MLRRVEIGLETVERQHPDQPVADKQGDGHPRPDASLHVDILELRVSRGCVRDDDGRVVLDQLPGRIGRASPAVAMPKQLVEVR